MRSLYRTGASPDLCNKAQQRVMRIEPTSKANAQLGEAQFLRQLLPWDTCDEDK